MNKRLQTIASLIEPGVGVIDVGTDHGYLPAALAASSYPGRLFASDINADPLSKARKTAALAGVSDRLQFLLCDGLRLCPPEKVDTIVIAGMGGDVIVKILDEAEWCMDRRYHLILQPMSKAEILRYWLVNNEFGIQRELLVEDGGCLYQILSVRFGSATKLRDIELFAGAAACAGDAALYRRQAEKLERRMQKALAGMEGREDAARTALYRELYYQAKELKESL